MSYIINNSRGQVIAVVADGTVNTTATDLALVGRALTEYGEYENENYVYLLENFANSTAPLKPITGQIWYDIASDALAVYNTSNAWVSLASQSYVQAQKVSPALTGIPTAPTAAAGASTTQLATTAFVTTAVSNYNVVATAAFAPKASPTLTGIPTAPTAAAGTSTTQIATTEFVTTGPAFSGIPTAPTAGNATSTTQLATTEFVQNQKVSPVLTGTPTAPTAAYGTNSTQIATTEFVQNEKESPTFNGVPKAPTAVLGVSNTQIATTRFVTDWTNAMPTMSQQNANSVNITGGTIVGINPIPVNSGGTGSSTVSGARDNLGLGSMAVQQANSVAITGGSISNAVIEGGTISLLSSPVPVASGGTGSATAAGARTNLGLGNIATQNINDVNITGGSITGISPLPVNSGGTSSNNATDARLNLGIGSIGTQDANSVAITGGSITNIVTFSSSGVSITGGTITNITDLAVTDGGTGASSASQARVNLGIGTLGTQDAGAVNITGGFINDIGTFSTGNATITGGSITGITDLAVVDGGTGASDAAGARTNLGLGTLSTQNANAVTISGGTISGVTVLASNNATITGGSISGITDLAIADGGTGASTAVDARTNLGAVGITTSVIAGTGLDGGGTLAADVTLAIAANSNGYGTRYVSSSAPSGGNNGDIWYQI